MKNILDLHTHTIASGHGYSTFQENVLAAYEKKLAVYGYSEHAPAMPGGPHPFYFGNMALLPDRYKEMRILKGCEANIINLEGELDLQDIILKKLDYVIASLHMPCVPSGTPKENTDCLIQVMQNPNVRIIGHPDDSRFPLEYERLVLAAKQYGVLLEVNNSSLRPTSARKGGAENVRTYLELCKRYEVPVILGSDSHYAPYIGVFDDAVHILEEIDFPEELVINNSLDKLSKYIPL